MNRIYEQEAELRAKAASDGYDPDENVSTEMVDQDHNNIEMPIWQTYFYG